MGARRGAYWVLVGKFEGNASLDGRIILRWISKKWDGGHGLD